MNKISYDEKKEILSIFSEKFKLVKSDDNSIDHCSICAFGGMGIPEEGCITICPEIFDVLYDDYIPLCTCKIYRTRNAHWERVLKEKSIFELDEDRPSSKHDILIQAMKEAEVRFKDEYKFKYSIKEGEIYKIEIISKKDKKYYEMTFDIFPFDSESPESRHKTDHIITFIETKHGSERILITVEEK